LAQHKISFRIFFAALSFREFSITQLGGRVGEEYRMKTRASSHKYEHNWL